MTGRKLLAPAMLIGGLLIGALPAGAQEEARPLDAFLGQWRGTDLATDQDTDVIPVEPGDLDVVLAAEDDGFRATWTEVVASGDGGDALRRQQTELFEPEDRPTVYAGEESGNPLEGEVLRWARRSGDTLSIYEMTLAPGGGFEMLSYDRTLRAEGGMEMVFRQIRDGEPVRTIRGLLARAGE